MKKLLLTYILILYTFLGHFSIVFADPDENNADNVEKTTVEAYLDDNGSIVPPELLAEGAVLMNADTGEILFEKNMHERLYPASITKIMTSILALENGSFEDVIYFSNYAVRSIEPGSSSIGMKPEEILNLDEALHGLMVTSANEVANALAEYVSGSIEEFSDLMTERAKALGAKNTSFKNPHGLHDDGHFTTPYDIAMIFRQGLEYPYFRDVIKSQYYQIPPTNITDVERNLYTKNRIIMKNSPYYYEYCQGGKTGFTDQAMHTLVTYAEKDGMRLIAAVMKTPPSGTYTDSKALYEYGFNFFNRERIFDRYSFSREIPVLQHTDKEEEILERGIIVAQAGEGVAKTLRKDILSVGFEQEITLPDSLEAPVSKGDKIGTLTLLSQGEEIASVDLLALNSVTALSDEQIAEMRRDEFIMVTKSRIPIYLTFIPIAILVIYLFISGIARMKRSRRDKKRYGYGSRSKYKFKNNR